jgi:hypothetical protein
MNMTEIGKQLGRDTAESLNGQAERLDLALKNIDDKEWKKYLGEFEAKLVPLAEAMSDIAGSAKKSVLDFQATTKETKGMVDEAYYQAKNAATRLEEAATRLPLKMWVAMLFVGVLSGPASVSAYWIWQHRLGQEKEQAASWRNFQDKFRGLHEKDQKEVMKILNRKR